MAEQSLERIIPDFIQKDEGGGFETLELHLARYRFAADSLAPGRVLDMACGVGYGTNLVLQQASDKIAEICGVDLNGQAIRYAGQRYAHPKANFIQADAMQFTDPRGFDTVISLETIEHVPDPVQFVSCLVNLLRPGGILVCSVPTTPSADVNPYHLHDFTEKAFVNMLGAHHLIEADRLEQIQPYAVVSILKKGETRLQSLRPNLLTYYLSHPLKALKRVGATVHYGFNNRYLTLACRKPG
jgi:2-polyprenyl-3-methyl-5-hydroxy-6-metoxy-1,4-benzoquinol methylase